jgi:hypothetical protein
MSTATIGKYVVEYQATDADGTPIGNVTHLVADTPEEMFEKQKQAHIAAVQALARQNKAFNDLKARKATPIVEAPKPKQLTPEEERTLVQQATQPATAKDAIRKLTGINELEERVIRAEKAEAEARGKSIALTFMRNHLHDFYPCEANSVAMKQFLTDNNLEFTVDNLEIAFAAIGNDLAKDPKLSTQNNANNEVNNEHEQTAPPSEQPRRTSFGMQPGTTTGVRPTGRAADGKMTKKDVINLLKTNKAEFKRRMNDPKLKAEMDAALARG